MLPVFYDGTGSAIIKRGRVCQTSVTVQGLLFVLECCVIPNSLLSPGKVYIVTRKSVLYHGRWSVHP